MFYVSPLPCSCFHLVTQPFSGGLVVTTLGIGTEDSWVQLQGEKFAAFRVSRFFCFCVLTSIHVSADWKQWPTGYDARSPDQAAKGSNPQKEILSRSFSLLFVFSGLIGFLVLRLCPSTVSEWWSNSHSAKGLRVPFRGESLNERNLLLFLFHPFPCPSPPSVSTG